MAIKIIKAGAFYAGAPLQVGEVKELPIVNELDLVNRGFAQILPNGTTEYLYSQDGSKVSGLVNPDTSIVPIVNLKSVVLSSGVAGSDSGWLEISPHPERLAYALDSGSTATAFAIDVSADGGETILSQAFTGSYSSSSVAEVTPPIQFNEITATHFRITVTSGGPITFLRGV